MSNEATPRVLGRYVLCDTIAAGGMATIHLGRLLGPVGFSRTVAIKRLHEQYAHDPEFVAMFLDEARIAARIRHPNVVSTLDVVALDQELFLVMDYIQGESLSFLLKRARMNEQPVPLGIAVHILIETLHGLHAAHEAQNEQGEPLHIVHRDVSPQNILVGTDGVTRVVDFGIAKASGRSAQTRDGQLKGKIQYMAPEQLRGTQVGRAADIYAAGVVLWEALTNRRLLANDNELESMYQIIEGGFAAPSTVNPAVSPELDAIVMRALAPSPDDRFENARRMALALDAAVTPVSTSTVADWVQSQAGDSLARRAEQISRIESLLTPISTIDAAPTVSPTTNPSISSSALPAVPELAPAAPPTSQVRRVVPLVLGGLVMLGLGWGVARSTATPAASPPAPPSAERVAPPHPVQAPAAAPVTASASAAAPVESAEPPASASASAAPPASSSPLLRVRVPGVLTARPVGTPTIKKPVYVRD